MKNYLKTYIKYLNETKGFWLLAWLFTSIIFGIISNICIVQNDIFGKIALNSFSDKEFFMHINEYNDMVYNINSYHMVINIAPIVVFMMIILEVVYKIRFHADSSEGMWMRLPFNNSVKESFFYISSLLLILINGIIIIIYAIKEYLDVCSIAAKRYQNIISSKGITFLSEFEDEMDINSNLQLFDYSDIFAVTDKIFTIILLTMIAVVIFYIIGSLINKKFISIIVQLILAYCIYDFACYENFIDINNNEFYFDNLLWFVFLSMSFKILLYIRSSFDNTKNKIAKLSFIGYLALGYGIIMEMYNQIVGIVSLIDSTGLIDLDKGLKVIFIHDLLILVIDLLLLIFLFLISSKDNKKIKIANKVFITWGIGVFLLLFEDIFNMFGDFYYFGEELLSFICWFGPQILICVVLFIVLKKKNESLVINSYNYAVTKNNRNYCKSVIFQYALYVLPWAVMCLFSDYHWGRDTDDLDGYWFLISNEISTLVCAYVIMKIVQLYFKRNAGGISEVNRVAITKKNKVRLKVICESAIYGIAFVIISLFDYLRMCPSSGIKYLVKYSFAGFIQILLIIAVSNLSETLISNAVLTGVHIISLVYIIKCLEMSYCYYFEKCYMAIKNYDATELYLRDILMVIWPYLALLCIALIILSVRLSERPLLANSMFYYKKYKTLFVIVVDLAIMLFIYAYELEMYQTIIVLIALLVISICMLFSKQKIIY